MTPSRLLLGVAGAAVLVEVGLRLSGPLPSLRAQPRPFEAAAYPSVTAIGPEPRGCIETDTGQPPPTAWRWMAGEGTDAPLRMLVVGDSVALGRGVNPRDTWAVGLAQRLASVHDRRVEVVNAAVNASGYCGAFRTIHHQAAHTTFDWVVVGLFADDLEQRAVVIDDGAVYANPQAVPGMVGMLASQSYAFNAVWLQILRAALARDADGVPSSFLGSGRTVPRATVDNLALAIRGVSQYKPLFILNPPAGMGYCFEPSAPPDCEWLQADMAQLADALEDSGEVWLDNRTLFDGETLVTTLPVEQDWLKKRGRLPVHPSPAGHRMIAETIPEDWLLSSLSRE